MKCPKCGREVKLACSHCGTLPAEQAGDLGAVMSKIWALSNGGQPTDATQSGASERYTPADLVESARRVLGAFDLDPASCKAANKIIKASRIYTRETDGLTKRWRGRIFANPPFGNFSAWIAKADEEIGAKRVQQAIIIGPANVEAFRPLLRRNGLLFIPDERPKYHDPDSDELIAPPFGTLLCYVGPRRAKFTTVFERRGIVLRA